MTKVAPVTSIGDFEFSVTNDQWVILDLHFYPSNLSAHQIRGLEEQATAKYGITLQPTAIPTLECALVGMVLGVAVLLVAVGVLHLRRR